MPGLTDTDGLTDLQRDIVGAVSTGDPVLTAPALAASRAVESSTGSATSTPAVES